MTHKDHVELLKKAVPENSGGVWADIGSGDGAFTLALRDLAGPEVEIFSVERDRGRLESQKRNFQHEFPGTSIHFMRTGVEDILILPPLDGLIMANSLHYFEHKEQILNKILRWVKSNGKFILVEYNSDQSNSWVPFPISFRTFEDFAPHVGLSEPRLISSVSSIFMQEIYSALTIKRE